MALRGADKPFCVAYSSVGADRRTVQRHHLGCVATKESAIREAAALKRRGMSAWVETDGGDFVPVKGAMRPAKRSQFSPHATDAQLPKWLRKR